MKKWAVYSSYSLNIILLTIIVYIYFFGDTDESQKNNLDQFTHQEISNSVKIKRGMSENDIIQILGQPIKNEIYYGYIEWHYCKTGTLVDEYIVVNFENGKLTRLLQYNVSSLDIYYSHTKTPNELINPNLVYGDCKLTFKLGDYESYTVNSK